jgi:shikimate kinase
MNAYHEKPLRLALVGMSGAGKSFWARHLALLGYRATSCDDRIEAALAPVLQAGNFQGIHGVAAWMGWPDRETYAERESRYLAEENAVLDEALTGLEKNPASELILDTTGSVIYCGNHLLHRLRKQMTVVYLEASAAERELLVRRYLEDPKPVLWRGAFQAKAGESSNDTVSRCYPMLAEARRRSYETLSHCAVPVGELRQLSLGAEHAGVAPGLKFLERVREQFAARA